MVVTIESIFFSWLKQTVGFFSAEEPRHVLASFSARVPRMLTGLHVAVSPPSSAPEARQGLSDFFLPSPSEFDGAKEGKRDGEVDSYLVLVNESRGLCENERVLGVRHPLHCVSFSRTIIFRFDTFRLSSTMGVRVCPEPRP